MRKVADNNVNKKVISIYVIFRDHILSVKLASRATIYSLLELFRDHVPETTITGLETLQTVALKDRVNFKYTFFCVWILSVILTLSTQFGAAGTPETSVSPQYKL
jgi:hypothetical protein